MTKNTNASNKSQKSKNTRTQQPQKTIAKRPPRKNRGARAMVGAATVTGNSSKAASIFIDRTERFATLTTAASGTTQILLSNYVNAGNLANATNSYLSKQAQLFDKYQFTKFEIEYVPVVSTATAGNVIIGMDMSANDAAPTDAISMTNLSMGYSEGNVWRSFKYTAQPFVSFSSGPKYVRSGTTQLGDTASLYDMGALYVFSEGAPVNTTLGYLDVHYRVQLVGINRNIPATITSYRPTAQAILKFASTLKTPGGVYNGTVFDTFYSNYVAANNVNYALTPTITTVYGNTSGIAVAAGNFTLGPGNWKIEAYATFVGITASTANVNLYMGSQQVLTVECALTPGITAPVSSSGSTVAYWSNGGATPQTFAPSYLGNEVGGILANGLFLVNGNETNASPLTYFIVTLISEGS